MDLPSARLQIEVFSDVVCPWCWIGKRRLERARAQLDFADKIDVHWRAFQLDPGASVEPRPYSDVLARKYGPSRRSGGSRAGSASSAVRKDSTIGGTTSNA